MIEKKLECIFGQINNIMDFNNFALKTHTRGDPK